MSTPFLENLLDKWLLLHAEMQCLSRQARRGMFPKVVERSWYLREDMIAHMVDEDMLELGDWLLYATLRRCLRWL